MDVTQTMGEARLLISHSALIHNLRLLRRTIPSTTRICAMVKANAYGHRASVVAEALINASAVDALAVVTVEEAAELPESNLPIYVLRPVENVYLGRERERLEHAIRNGWILTVGSMSAAGDVARTAIALGRRAAVQIMIDTGQAREGAPLSSVGPLIASIDSQPSLRLAALATHFVSGEEPENPFTREQLRRFLAATDTHAHRNPRLLRHAANSGAIFFARDSHLDMVRPGIALYGIDPTCRPSADRPLRPALKWVAPLHMIRDIRKGETVGYNQTWQAKRDSRIGLVPVGYADGYQRAFSNSASMLLHGRPAPVVGRVSMDWTTIDVTDIPRANLGDSVTILDDDPLSPASVYALAKLAQTIPYEIFCHIGPRIPAVSAEAAAEEQPSEPEQLRAAV